MGTIAGRQQPKNGASEPRDNIVKVCLSDSELAMLDARRRNGGSRSGILRRDFLNGCERRRRAGIWSPDTPQDELPPRYRIRKIDAVRKARADCNRVGNNLNQIARVLNSGGAPASEDITRALDECRDAVLAVNESVLAIDGIRGAGEGLRPRL